MNRGSSKPSMRVVIVGAGEVAESYWLPAARTLGWDAAVMDVDHGRASEVAARFGRRVRPVASPSEAAITERDVFVVATPPTTHGALMREGVASGARRVIVEKPPFASSEDMSATMRVLREHGAAARSAFIRRNWAPVSAARRLYGAWHERFGCVRSVRLTEGRPYGWKARGTSERGIAGLSSMLLDEIPHGLDALWHVTGWNGVMPDDVRVDRLDPLGVDATVSLQGDEPVQLHILGSRTGQLPNALDLVFEQGSVSIDISPQGGLIVEPRGGDRTLIQCDEGAQSVEATFGRLLQTAAAEPLSSWKDELEAWTGPLAVIERIEQRG